jgi:hypothetical protein
MTASIAKICQAITDAADTLPLDELKALQERVQRRITALEAETPVRDAFIRDYGEGGRQFRTDDARRIDQDYGHIKNPRDRFVAMSQNLWRRGAA